VRKNGGWVKIWASGFELFYSCPGFIDLC